MPDEIRVGGGSVTLEFIVDFNQETGPIGKWKYKNNNLSLKNAVLRVNGAEVAKLDTNDVVTIDLAEPPAGR